MYGIIICESSISVFEEKIIEVSKNHNVIFTDFSKFKNFLIFTAWCQE